MQSPYHVTDDGFLVVCSGSAVGVKEFAGVGFVVAPWIRGSVVGFIQNSNRIACLKLRVPQGKIALIYAYAPHGGYPFDIRQSFFSQLSEAFEKTSVNGLKLICGDLNSRIQNPTIFFHDVGISWLHLTNICQTCIFLHDSGIVLIRDHEFRARDCATANCWSTTIQGRTNSVAEVRNS